jgi:tetratricopeptide (TPR) repeat protein
MTDLSWETNAESKCESLITEALLVAPHSPEPLQTLASIRISQTRIPEAKKALADSIALWKDLPPEDTGVPDFPTRISLARLLMEVEMEEEALEVVERLVTEDDQSVEAWYLGGWCLYLLGEKRTNTQDADAVMHDGKQGEDNLRLAALVSSREWLRQSLTLYEMLEYEDERLRDHAKELVEGLHAQLREYGSEDGGDGVVDGKGDSEDEDEDEEDEDENHEMDES